MGNWIAHGLERSWYSPAAIEFRRKIAQGEYPDDYCKACHNNGTSTSLRKLLLKPLVANWQTIKNYDLKNLPALSRLQELFDARELSEEGKRIIAGYGKAVEALESQAGRHPDEYRLAIEKLKVIGQIVEDFLTGEVRPRNIAPLRETNLIAVCNARCVQCPGKYNGVIEHGVQTQDGTFLTEMESEVVDKSFAHSHSIIDFFTNGSELLLLKSWEHVARRLKEIGSKLRVSTNGMLLTEQNVRKLIDNGYIDKLNMSLDAATPELLESIRVRVKFDRIVRNIKFLYSYVESKSYPLSTSFTFCLMKRNYHELPRFVDLVADLVDGRNVPVPNIMIQPLALKGHPDYRDFVGQEHHTFVDRPKLVEKFHELQRRSHAAKIPVLVFFKYTIDQFIEQGCPLPAMTFVDKRAAEAEEEFDEIA
jgi:sulfatase maturation enzyme AslB (radical SAM superfamily)